MFKKLFSMILVLILVIGIGTNSFATYLENDLNLEQNLEYITESISESNEPLAPVRRIWYTTGLYFPSGNPPSNVYYEHNGFRGYLTYQPKDVEYENIYLYSGYLYHPNYPYPTVLDNKNLEILESDKIFLEQEIFNQDMVEIQAHTKYINKHFKYDNIWDAKKYYVYNDGFYKGRLEILEYWQNSDYSWDVYYGGYVTSDKHAGLSY